MAKVTASLAPDNSSAAGFRAWWSWISAQLAAFGWVQSADTGQINWTTVGNPTTAK